MKVIHLLRKPLSESTVASNTLKHGVGGLNIDGCRVSTGDNLNGGRYAEHGVGEADGSAYGHGINKRRPGEYQQPSGRWPGNLILQHFPECRCAGTRKVKGHQGYPNGPGGKSDPMHGWGGKRSAEVRPNAWSSPATDTEGKETIAVWECVEGCPVKALDEQSGTTKSSNSVRRNSREGEKTTMAGKMHRPEGFDTGGYVDTGGASRFFKQVGGGSDSPSKGYNEP